MRIIFLNSWFGKVGKPFFDFIKKESLKTDIFCFMEFSPDLFTKTSKILNDYKGFIEKGMTMTLEPRGVVDCQVIFTRKGLKILSSGKLNLYKNTSKDTGFTSYIVISKNGKKINVLNVHGKCQPGHKLDTPARLKQSKTMIDFIKDKKGSKVIGGDFNLMPDTKSIKMFEEAGYRNLIKGFKVENTRNKLSWDQFNNIQLFADYVFTSPDVKINNFEVPYMEVSDHLPLILEFEV